jgi:hypothetical protein
MPLLLAAERTELERLAIRVGAVAPDHRLEDAFKTVGYGISEPDAQHRIGHVTSTDDSRNHIRADEHGHEVARAAKRVDHPRGVVERSGLIAQRDVAHRSHRAPARPR